MNRFQLMLAIAALSATDYPIGNASEPTDPNKRLAPANRAKDHHSGGFGLPIPYSTGCNCAKCDPDDAQYPTGKKHLYRTVEAPKGKRTTRAQRKAQNAKGKR